VQVPSQLPLWSNVPSQAANRPSASRKQVLLRSATSVALTASTTSAGSELPNSAPWKALVPSSRAAPATARCRVTSTAEPNRVA
jgi:hypothetical protein